MSSHPSLAPAIPEEPEARRRPAYDLAKRLMDAILSLGAILFTLPLLALVALLIRLDSPGPVLFRQRRGGLHGRAFAIFKFRTMTVLEDGPRIVQPEKGDPRITRMGRLLRPLFLDELPQLFNVLRGEMSFVGPRPHAIAHDAYYGARIAGYGRRHAVKPGITGWAQINGANGPTPRLSDMQARIECDMWYAEHASLALDLLILALTPLAIWRRTGGD